MLPLLKQPLKLFRSIMSFMGTLKRNNLHYNLKEVDARANVYYPPLWEFQQWAGLGLVRLEDVYGLNKTDMVQGNIILGGVNRVAQHKLDEWDCR